MATTVTVSVSVGIYADTLKLCFSKGKERNYKSISKCLLGKFVISHWDNKKHRIKPSVPYSEENNNTIIQLLSKYNDVIANNKSITVKELSCFFDEKKSHSLVSIDELIKRDIARERQKNGCNYKNYEKLHRRLLEFRPDLANISISMIDEAFCAGFRNWLIDVHKINYEKITKCFMALLRRISEDKAIAWSIESINGYNFKKNAPVCNRIDELPNILNENEIQSFYSFNPVANKGKRDSERVEIYQDYCIFMLETYMRPVDVLLLKHENIKIHNIAYKTPFIQYIPKKKENLKNSNKTTQVPLSPMALRLIEKYKNQSSDGFIFPIANNERIKGYRDGIEGFSKRINLQINEWLKTVDKALNLNKGLHLYIFRHTAISIALNVRKIPASTVSKIAGTSIANIEKHYNNHLIADIPVGILEAFESKEVYDRAI
jgi:integrase